MESLETRVAIEPGQTLDHFRLDALVAESAIGRTFRATDLRDGRTAAIKVPHASIEADPVGLERLRREEEIGTTLDHPNVMRIYHESHRSRFYLIMEWCNGRTLREILKDDPRLPPERAICVTTGVLLALEYMHQHGVVHRDLSPDHVMVDDRDQVKLIDFGLAFREGARRVTFTTLSPALGSPDYIAPEQVKGKRGDARSDLYSVGIMLWEMLSGRVPFTGRSPLAIMNARLTSSPSPLLLPDFAFSAQLQEVICRATEREPAHRYATAHEFIRDLEHLDQVGVAHRPELTRSASRKTLLSSRLLLYALIALIPVALFAMMLLLARSR